MLKTSSIHPQWATKHKRPGTELRFINQRYYLYEYHTVYDSTRKRARKISGACLGSITEQQGFTPSAKRLVQNNADLKVSKPILIKEFGVSSLVKNRFGSYQKKLAKFFPDDWAMILAVAYCRFVYRCPLKSIPFRLDSSFVPEMFEIKKYNDKTASGLLNKLGQSMDQVHQYMRSFIKTDDYILMNGTNIISKSDQIDYAKKGYNNQFNFDGQINLMYVYSATQHMPVYYRLLPGNIRDVKAFKNTLLLAGLKKAVIIADKGFYSQANVKILLEEKLSFIIPLKRDSSHIDYQMIGDNTFKNKANFFEYQKRMIWQKSVNHSDGFVLFIMDDSLNLKEKTYYLSRTKNKPEQYTLEAYQEKRNTFGTIALLTDKKLEDAQDVYETYKSRLYIETMFDGMKNILDADHTYMQNKETLEGWLFINHICLQWYQDLYIELKDKKLLKKLSVNDYIQLLTDVKKIKINDQWHLNDFTNATKKLMISVEVKI